jgi:hypothetical protein
MKVYQWKEVVVKRDMNLVRNLLLTIEDKEQMDGTRDFMFENPEQLGISGFSTEEVAYHIRLLIEGGYVNGAITLAVPMQIIRCLTNQGHDFVDTIRDQGIWAKVKKRLAGLPSAPLSVIMQIALAEFKKHYGLA